MNRVTVKLVAYDEGFKMYMKGLLDEMVKHEEVDSYMIFGEDVKADFKRLPKEEAFDYCMKSINSRYEEIIHEGELLEQDLRDGEKGVGLSRKCFENTVKAKLMREILCFMRNTLDECREGGE